MKLKLGQWVSRWETTNCKPSGPIIMMCQWETPRADLIYYNSSLCTGAQHCCAFCQIHFPDMLTSLHPMWLCTFRYWTELEMLLVGAGVGAKSGRGGLQWTELLGKNKELWWSLINLITPIIIMLLENFGKKKRVVDSSRSAEELFVDPLMVQFGAIL